MTENKEGMMASQKRTRSQTKKNVLTTGVIDNLEDVKPSILKYVDPAMLKDPVEAVVVKQEVDDDFIKVEHELDPLSVTDIKPQDVIMQLVSDIQMCKDNNITPETLSLGLTDKGAIEQELTGTKLKVEVEFTKEKDHLGCSDSLMYKLLSQDHNQNTLYESNQFNYLMKTDNLMSLQEKTSLKTNPIVTDSYSQNYHSTQDETESHNLHNLINDKNDDSIDAGGNEFIDDGITSENQQVNKTRIENSFEQITRVKSLQNTSGHMQSFSYKPVNGDLNQSACIKRNQGNDSWNNKIITQEGENCHDLHSRINDDNKSTNANSKSLNEGGDDCEIVQISKLDSSDIYKSYIKSVQNHVIYIPKRKYFSCELCKKKYNRKHKLREHEESKCGSLKLYNCNACNKAFVHKRYLQYHLNNQHNNHTLENKEYKCEQCNHVFKRIKSLNRHQKEKHEQRNNHTQRTLSPQTCQYCQKTYQSIHRLKEHIRKQHTRENVECAHCLKKFTHKHQILFHIKRHHLPDQLKCSVCSLPLDSQENLEKHMLRHSEGKKFICDHCGKTLKSNFSLMNHLRTHTDEKPFMCQDCGKCFRTESNLVQHSVVHSERRPFACNQCSSSFRLKSHLRQHMAVHGLVNTSVKRRKIRKKKSVNIN